MHDENIIGRRFIKILLTVCIKHKHHNTLTLITSSQGSIHLTQAIMTSNHCLQAKNKKKKSLVASRRPAGLN